VTRVLVPIIAFALGLGAALALVSCGDDEEGLLPGDTAAEILQNLDAVERRAAAGDCTEAADAADEVAAQVEGLGPDVSDRLKRALAEGAARLEEEVATCVEEPVEPLETDTTEIPTEEPTDTIETDQPEEGDEGEDGEEGDEGEEPTETAPPTDIAPPTDTTPTPTVPVPPTDGGDGGTGSGGIGPGRITGED